LAAGLSDEHLGELVSDSGRVVVDEPTLLTATATDVEDGEILAEYRSIIVKEHGDLYAPVREVLERSCTTRLHSETVNDREMMFGKAIQTLHKVWGSCPGIRAHDCVVPRVPRARLAVEIDGLSIRFAGQRV
jgi:hypothetical protein